MNVKYLLILLLFISSNLALAQLDVVKGQVSDTQTNSMLSGVTIRTGAYATLTNSDGYFELKAPVKALTENGISFSHVGYLSSRLIYQPDHFYTVELLESTTEIAEVVIGIKGEDIVKKAIRKIPENYPDKPIAIKGITRVQMWRNQSEYFKSDALIQAYIPSYSSNEKTTVSVLQNRIDTITDKSLRYLRYYSAYNLINFQDIAHNNALMDKISKKKKFDYLMTGIQTFNNHKVFVINTDMRDASKTYDKIEATFYIDTVSYAFVAANIYTYNRRWIGSLPADTINHRIEYEKIGKKWYIKEAHAAGIYRFGQESPRTRVNFVRTKIDSINAEPMQYKDVVQRGDNIFLIDKPGDQEEWATYEQLFNEAENTRKLERLPSVLLDTIRLNNAINQNRQKTFGNRIYEYIGKDNIRSWLGLTKFPVTASSESYSVPDIVHYGIGVGYNFRLYKNIFLGFEAQSNIWNKKKIRLSTFGLNLSYDFIFNQNARNTVLSPHIGFSNISTRFEKTDAGYTVFDYGLRASYELTHRRALFISSGFNSARGASTLNTLTITPTGYTLGAGFVFKL